MGFLDFLFKPKKSKTEIIDVLSPQQREIADRAGEMQGKLLELFYKNIDQAIKGKGTEYTKQLNEQLIPQLQNNFIGRSELDSSVLNAGIQDALANANRQVALDSFNTLGGAVSKVGGISNPSGRYAIGQTQQQSGGVIETLLRLITGGR